MEEGDMRQGMQEASGSWKRQGNRFSPTALRRNTSALILAQRADFGLFTYSTDNKSVCVF